MNTCLMCGTNFKDEKRRWCPNCGVHLGISLTGADKTLPGNNPTRSSYAAGNRWYRTPELAQQATEALDGKYYKVKHE
jgi:hypothetical protein